MHRYHWLEELHIAHYAKLLRLARNRLYAATGSTSEAEDVVQDVFLLAAEKDIRNVPNPVGWLMKATVNLCMQRVDRLTHEEDKERRFIRNKLDISTDRSVYALEREESGTEVLLWLLMLEKILSPEDWDILRKYCLLGVPIGEIAAGMDAPVNRLKVRIHRIRKKLDKIKPDV